MPKGTPEPARTMLRGRGVRDIGVLVGGALGARLIGILAMPVISRLFDPDVFGRASFLIALATMITIISTLTYEHAIVLPAHDAEASRVGRLAGGLLAATGFLVLPLAGLALPSAWRPEWFGDGVGVWLLLGLLVLVRGGGNIAQSFAMRHRRFAALAHADLAENAGRAGGRIAWGLTLPANFTGLIVPHIAALLARLLILGRAAIRKAAPGAAATDTPPPGNGQPSAPATAAAAPASAGSATTRAGEALESRSLAGLARRYANFPLLGLPSRLMRQLSDRLPLLVLGTVFAPAVVGFYAAADRLLQSPVASFTLATRRVVIQRVARRRQQAKPVLRVVLLALAGLAALGAPVFVALALYGEVLLTFALGADWREAGRFAQAMAPWAFTTFCMGPAGAVFVSLEQQRWLVVLSTLRLTAVALVAVWMSRGGMDAIEAVTAFALAGTGVNLLQVAVGIVLAVVHDRRGAAGSAGQRPRPPGPGHDDDGEQAP